MIDLELVSSQFLTSFLSIHANRLLCICFVDKTSFLFQYLDRLIFKKMIERVIIEDFILTLIYSLLCFLSAVTSFVISNYNSRSL